MSSVTARFHSSFGVDWTNSVSGLMIGARPAMKKAQNVAAHRDGWPDSGDAAAAA